jgi:LuxR family maltose regulon positive regulatory protein
VRPLSARKEARQRGDCYWYAYLATGEHLSKKYLGKTTTLILTRLEQVAGVLEAEQSASRLAGQETPPLLPPASVAQISPTERLASASTEAEVEATQRPLLAQRDTPLHPLLAIKLHVPRPRTRLVTRAHLMERLQQGMACQLTLISAPAGFGKTMLLTQWLAETRIPVAWLSLEPEDNDPTHFLSYLIAALQNLDAQMGITALELLHTAQPPPQKTVLAVLTNDLMSHNAEDFALVLDDYHLITADSIHRGMAYLVEHLPPQMHLLATRTDPPFPLTRLRARGQLCEVRAADLRFGAAEVNTFLQIVMGLDLEASAIAILERHTEGWIAGLQQAKPMLVPLLHWRASDWYEQRGLPAEAVRHALAVPDFERAARLSAASSTILAWETCRVSGTAWRRRNSTWSRAWHWSTRRCRLILGWQSWVTPPWHACSRRVATPVKPSRPWTLWRTWAGSGTSLRTC